MNRDSVNFRNKLYRFSKVNINEIYKILKTSVEGLTLREGNTRNEKYGENTLVDSLKFLKDEKYNVTVYREKEKIKIPVEQLTIGDIISLEENNYIPADIRIICCENFMINESCITGYSNNIIKHEHLRGDYHIDKSEVSLDNICLQGMKVIRGTALAVVIAIGKDTYISNRKNHVASIDNTKIKREKFKIIKKLIGYKKS
ncbi:P-type ATPase [Clostridium sp.]|uniref:P-type ATPase n=1 Tax=Clostridium sp. TaxID=1506 RepID=UPI003F2A0A31